MEGRRGRDNDSLPLRDDELSKKKVGKREIVIAGEKRRKARPQGPKRRAVLRTGKKEKGRGRRSRDKYSRSFIRGGGNSASNREG